MLAGLQKNADYESVLETGAILERIRTGFRPTKPQPARYADPGQPLDFAELAELFATGQIVIRIEPTEKDK